MKNVFYSEEVERLNKVKYLYDNQKNKVYNYIVEDFEIDSDFSFRHKTWKTWLLGGKTIEETKNLIDKYINEVCKPYGQRNLDFIHLKAC